MSCSCLRSTLHVQYSEMAQKPDYSAQEEEEESGDKSFFEYLGPAYKVFLAGEDEQYSELEKEEAEKRGAGDKNSTTTNRVST